MRSLILAALLAAAPLSAQAEAALVTARHHHVGVVVADLTAQAQWYRRAFGLVQVDRHQPTPDIRTAVLRAPNGLQVELVEAKGSRREHRFATAIEGVSIQGYGHWAVMVDDVDAAHKALLAAGATSARAPAAGPGGARFAYVADPEGNLIELIQEAP